MQEFNDPTKVVGLAAFAGLFPDIGCFANLALKPDTLSLVIRMRVRSELVPFLVQGNLGCLGMPFTAGNFGCDASGGLLCLAVEFDALAIIDRVGASSHDIA